MTTFSNPLLFSQHFKIDPKNLADAGLIDPFLTVDTQLFVDPILLGKSEHRLIREDGYRSFCAHFQRVIRLLAMCKREGDPAWKAAQQQMSLREAPANGLGYGTSDRPGNSRPNELRDVILRTAKEIVELGTQDPEMISLMGFFEENVGPDTISDLTSRVIQPQLARLTNEFCDPLGIPLKVSDATPDIALPHYTNAGGKERALVLVPSDIVRELPVARSWDDIEAAIDANALIRQRVNALLASIAQPTVADRKEALRSAAMQSKDVFEAFIAAVKESATYYDPNIDALGYYRIKEILQGDLNLFRSDQKYDVSKGVNEIKKVVLDTIERFAHHIEKGNLWEALWIGDKPKKERAAQLIYFAMSDCFCEANDIDISPEANMGGGPIDFKYSKGYHARVLVEMKRSMGQVVHGYNRQLEIYKNASGTDHGFFVILDYGGLGNKLENIQQTRRERLARGEPASEIVVIDASKKASASKRE
ncbi:chromosomal replication initiator DnaA [Stappia sp. WLB 29]|uniref:chromosomal replication initiator DnaA n=1 Tax=Stappia sp. WLB 29 TaxID=2925220 RepID=UPI0020BDD069|nr:chromosomal replication initiator DnaA [Stappia sp. WLB 29]